MSRQAKQSIAEHINHQHAAATRLAEIKADYTSRREHLSSLRVREAQLSTEVASYGEALVRDVGNRNITTPDRLNPESDNQRERWAAQHYRERRGELTRLRQQISDEEARLHALNEEIREAIAKQEAHRSTSLKEVLEHQGRVAAAEQRVEELRTRISEQRKIIDGGGSADLEMARLQREKEDILAGVATGASDDSALDSLNKRIGEATRQLEASSAQAAAARQTINGLWRQLQAAETELEALNGQSAQVLEHYLKTLLAEAAADYLEKARAFEKVFVRMVGLGSLIEEKHLGRVLAPDWMNTFIPIFNVECMKDAGSRLPGSANHRALITAHRSKALSTEANRAIVEEIRHLGVTLV